MLKYLYIITLYVSLRNTNCQRVINTVCTLELTGDVGVCRLLNDCPKIKEDIIKNQRLPQTCGFQNTQAIVCCPIDISGERRKLGSISNKRCRQYSSISNNNECGHKIVKRIVGGVKANRHEFPHMVILGFDKSPGVIEWTCAGSLISHQFILTEAQCLATRDYGPVKYVKMGATNINDADRQQFNIIDHIRHPEYSPLSLYNNIALLKLERPINISQSLRPACLYTGPELPDEGVVTGWGRTEFNGEPSDLLKVTIPILDHETCSKIFDVTRKLKQGILKKSQFCAGTKGKDTCQGDAGGPLQVVHSGDDIQCMYDIVGLTSFGKVCGFRPGVYTKIYYYLQWIEDIVWPTFSQLLVDD